MTLTRQKTDFFLVATKYINEPTTSDISDFWKWAAGFSGFSDTEYNALVDELAAMAAEYNTQSLYGTAPTGSSYLLTGIDRIPIPPKK